MIIQKADRLSQVSEYYFSKKLKQIQEMRAQGLQILNLGIGSPDLPPPDAVIQQLEHTAGHSTSHGYQSYRGIPALREAMADFYKQKFRVLLDAEHEVLPLIGSKEGIFHVSMAFLDPGDTVLLPNPGYPAYAAVSKLFHTHIEHYTLREEDGWRIDLDELRKKDLSKVKVLWTNFLHMPTGTDADIQEFTALIELAHQHRFLIVNDNPYSLVMNQEPKSILALDGASEVALELNSLSKSHNMAGWRVGWLSGKKSYIDTVLQVKSNVDSGMFKGIQDAAIVALASPQQWYDALNEAYQRRRNAAEELTTTLGCTFRKHQKGMFLWAKIPHYEVNTQIWCDHILQKHHFFITPGFIFGTQGERYIRISLCNPVSTFQNALERIHTKP